MDNYSRQFSDAELSRIEKRLKKEYTQASKEMQQKRDSIMKSYAKERDKRLSSLDGSDEAKKAFEDWCKDQAMRQKWVNDMAEELARQAAEVDKSAMGIVRDSVAEVFAEGANFAAYDIERQSLVNTNFTLLNRNAVIELAKDDPKLLPAPKVNVPKDIAWNKRHFSSAITQGILQGESVNDIGKRLTQVLDMDMRAAMRNARTAVNSAENLGTMHSFELAEEMGINLKKRWLSTMDDRTRDSHIVLDGEEVDNDEPFSNGLMFPSDPNGEPAEVYNCRCTMVAAIDGHDMSDAERNSKLGDMSYEEWKEEAQNRLNATDGFDNSEVYNKPIQNGDGGYRVFNYDWEFTQKNGDKWWGNIYDNEGGVNGATYKAFIKYQNSSVAVNEQLRSGNIKPSTATQIRKMESALNNSEVKVPFVCQRESTSSLLGFNKQISVEQIRSMIGQVVTDNGFMSCVPTSNDDYKFSLGKKFKGMGANKSNLVQYHMMIPKGTGIGGEVLGARWGERWSSASEFILNRGSSFRIVGAYEVDGVVHCNLQYIGREVKPLKTIKKPKK